LTARRIVNPGSPSQGEYDVGRDERNRVDDDEAVSVANPLPAKEEEEKTVNQ